MRFRIFFLFILITRLVFSMEYTPYNQVPAMEQDPSGNIIGGGLGRKTVFTAWGDYDLDGDPDLYVVNDGAPNALYRNEYCTVVPDQNGRGPCRDTFLSNAGSFQFIPWQFTEMTLPENKGFFFLKDGISSSRSAHWIDYDQDGDLDLYVVNDGMNRLFINTMFSVEHPFDPLSNLTLQHQIQQSGGDVNGGFTYKVSNLLRGQIGNTLLQPNVMDSDERFRLVHTGSSGALNDDIFTDNTANFVNAQLTPGMYLQVSAQQTRYRYVILEVLGEHKLRLERPFRVVDYPSFSSVLTYYVLEDVNYALEDMDFLSNCGSGYQSPDQTRIRYDCPGSSLNQEYIILRGDKVLLSQKNTTYTTMAEVYQDPGDSKVWVSPIPNSANGTSVLTADFDLVIRRAGGEVLEQNYFQTSSLDNTLQVTRLGALDKMLFLESATNTNGTSAIVERVGTDNKSIWMLPAPEGPAVVNEDRDVVYDVIYNSAYTQTRRVLYDETANFGAPFDPENPIAISEGAPMRWVKQGDWIVLDPSIETDLDTAPGNSKIAGFPATLRDELRRFQYKTTEDRANRPGVMEVLGIIDKNRLLVDSYPSEVGLPETYNNQNFPYQVRHQFGRLRTFDSEAVSGQEGYFLYFEESAPQLPYGRDFLKNLGFFDFETYDSQFYTSVIARNISATLATMHLKFTGMRGSPYEANVQNSWLKLETARSTGDFSKTTGIEYRPIYRGVSGNPYYYERQKLYLPLDAKLDEKGVDAGHYIVLRKLVQGVAQTRIAKSMQIASMKATVDAWELTLANAMPAELRTALESLCTAQPGTCNPGSEQNTDVFFKDFPTNLLSVEYEFLTTQAFGKQLVIQPEVTLHSDTLDLTVFGLQAGDGIQFNPPLNAGVTGAVLAEAPTTSSVRLAINDASKPPFNSNLARGDSGIQPVFRGTLTDSVKVCREGARFSTAYEKGDKLIYLKYENNVGFVQKAMIALDSITDTCVQLETPLGDSVAAEDVQTDPFYFRIASKKGRIFRKPVFKHMREGLNFNQTLNTGNDGSIRGIVLLDLYKQSAQYTDPLHRRLRPIKVLDNQILELEPLPESTKNEDISSGYFYQLKVVKREYDIVTKSYVDEFPEQDHGNGVSAEFADWNNDGMPDLYILNRQGDAKNPTWKYNDSIMLYGAEVNEPQIDADDELNVFRRYIDWRVTDTVSGIADNNRLLQNKSFQIPDEVRNGVTVKAGDFDGDRADGLLILNKTLTASADTTLYRDGASRLFYTAPNEDMVQLTSNLFAQPPIDDPEGEGTLRYLNTSGMMTQARWFSGALVGDVNYDGRDDVMILINSPSPTDARAAGLSVHLAAPTGNFSAATSSWGIDSISSLLSSEEYYAKVGGQFVDYNQDGFIDISLITGATPYIIEPKFRTGGYDSVASVPVLTAPSCGIVEQASQISSSDWPNTHISWADFNKDGYEDYYISRAGTSGATNVLCLARPPEQSNNYFAIRLVPRDLHLRRDRTAKVKKVRVVVTSASDASRTFSRTVKYSYPNVPVVKIGTQDVWYANIRVYWSEDTYSDYGNEVASSLSRDVIELLQPVDVEVTEVESGRASLVQTWVGRTTTNIEALGLHVSATDRENLILEHMSAFLRVPQGTNADIVPEEGSPVIPAGSVKLYLDSSPNVFETTDFTKFIGNGTFDSSVDILLAATGLTPYAYEQGVTTGYPYYDTAGNAITAGVFKAEFDITGYTSVNQQETVTRVILPKSANGSAALSVPLLLVYTLDQVQDSKAIVVSLPVRTGFGFENYYDNLGRESVEKLNFGRSPYHVSYDVSMRGEVSNQVYRAIPYSSTATSVPSVSELTGVLATVDVTSPTLPSVNLTSNQTNSTSFMMRGFSDAGSTVRIQNITKGDEPKFSSVVGADRNWQILLTNLIDGENTLEVVALDEFSNITAPVTVKIFVDTLAPLIVSPNITNINIAKGTVTWETDQDAIGSVTLYARKPDGTYYAAQGFTELPLNYYKTEHEIVLGMPKKIRHWPSYEGDTCQEGIPQPVNPSTGQETDEHANGLCPGTTYLVQVFSTDPLGNMAGPVELQFTTLSLSTNDEDYDGDGLPNSMESRTDFPDLDPFDANDAILDFDNDGINNVEEYNNGTDMYQPLDSLPIPSATVDRNKEPGIDCFTSPKPSICPAVPNVNTFYQKPGMVYLTASNSNFNGIDPSQITYLWTLESAPEIPNQTGAGRFPVIFNSTGSDAYFSANISGDYVVSLTLANTKGASPKADQLTVHVVNLAPLADAGKNHFGYVDTVQMLDGRASRDPNREELSYRWSQLRGPDLSGIIAAGYGLQNEYNPLTSFRTNRTGEYVFELIVKDPQNVESRDTVTVFINSSNDVYPSANAGPDLLGNVNTPIQLQGELSSGRAAGTALSYEWNLIVPGTQNVAEECSQYAEAGAENHASDLLWVSGDSSRFTTSPSFLASIPGLYAFNLTVTETGKGLVSAPDCATVLVMAPGVTNPIANPKIFGQPVPQGTTVNASINAANAVVSAMDYDIYRTPLNYEVQISGEDSYVNVNMDRSYCYNANNEWICPKIDSCLNIDGPWPYKWKQTQGPDVTLRPVKDAADTYPVFSDCSLVRFTPVEVGVYAFELEVYTKDRQTAEVRRSQPRTLVVVANDPYNNINNNFIWSEAQEAWTSGAENNFIPYVEFSSDSVVSEGAVTLPQAKCMDPDTMTSSAPYIGEYSFSQQELRACSSLEENAVTCVWSQLDGPTASLQFNDDAGSCAPWFMASAGTYKFQVQVFDGIFYSLPAETTIVVVGRNKSVPIANAGNPKVATVGEVVSLSGNYSIAKGNFNYLWRQRGGLQVILNGNRTAAPSFTPPAAGDYVFELQIQDSEGVRSLPDKVKVSVQKSSSSINQPTKEEEQQAFELEGGGGGGGCFIVTAVSGSKDSWLVHTFTEFRDNFLMHFSSGQWLMKMYYRYSPPIADYLKSSPVYSAVIEGVLYPLAIGVKMRAFTFPFLGLLLLIALFPRWMRKRGHHRP